MVAENFENCSDAELRELWHKLECDDVGNLPKKLKEFIITDNPLIGNEATRVHRAMKLIRNEVMRRFNNK